MTNRDHEQEDVRLMFDIVTLRTGEGSLVVRARIPRFRPPVEVLGWGQRLFGRREDGDYYEVFYVVVLPEWEVTGDEHTD